MNNILRFLKFVRPYWFWILLGITFIVTVTILHLPVPMIMKFLIDKVLKLPEVEIKILNFSSKLDSRVALNYIFLTLLSIYVIRACVVYGSNFFLSLVSHRILLDIRMTVFKHLQTLSMRYYDTRQTGRIMARITSDVDTLANLSRELVVELSTETLTLLAVIVILINLNYKLAILAFIILPLYAVNFMKFRKRIRQRSLSIRESW